MSRWLLFRTSCMLSTGFGVYKRPSQVSFTVHTNRSCRHYHLQKYNPPRFQGRMDVGADQHAITDIIDGEIRDIFIARIGAVLNDDLNPLKKYKFMLDDYIGCWLTAFSCAEAKMCDAWHVLSAVIIQHTSRCSRASRKRCWS
jgi:hypothetical protein